MTSDVEQIRTFAGSGVVQMAAAMVMLAGTTTLLLIIDWQLALLALTVVPVIFVLLLRFVRRIGPLFRGVQQTLGRLNSVLQEDLAGVRVIRTFAREDYGGGRPLRRPLPSPVPRTDGDRRLISRNAGRFQGW